MWRWWRALSFLPFPALAVVLWRWPIATTPPIQIDFDGDRAFANLVDLQARFPARVPATPAHTLARAHIAEKLRQLGYTPRIQEFSSGGKKLANVLVERAGERRETIVVGAHYDTIAPSGGAADNGAGVGALLELARVFAPSKKAGAVDENRPTFSLVFAFWDGEETGLLGSKRWVETNSARAKKQTVAALAFDAIGCRGGAFVAHTFSRSHRGTPRRIAPRAFVESLLRASHAAGAKLDVGDSLLTIPYQVAVRLAEVPFGSDDAPFIVSQIPAAFLADFSFTRQYAHYHRETDTPERLDAARVAAAGRTAEAFIKTFARAGTRAPWDEDYVAVGGQTFGALALVLLIVAAAIPRLFVIARELAFGAPKTADVAHAVVIALSFIPAAFGLFFFAVVVTPIVYASGLPRRWWATALALPLALSPLIILVAARLQFGSHFALDLPWLAIATFSFWVAHFFFRPR
ncbi:MAG: Zn-dependent exopeptidase M28 [Deltaproteobacteria bacterium]|nr:Zn-dependent exopeptidase M28 [Deltaproteobacteria bacterium]